MLRLLRRRLLLLRGGLLLLLRVLPAARTSRGDGTSRRTSAGITGDDFADHKPAPGVAPVESLPSAIDDLVAASVDVQGEVAAAPGARPDHLP